MLRKHTLIFAFFSLIVAPLEFHMNWYYGVRHGSELSSAITQALVTGVLFFYSVTISIEGLLRLDSHPDIGQRTAVTVLKSLCWLPLFVFLLEFAQDFRKRQPDEFAFIVQLICAIFSFALATVIHGYITRVENALQQEETT